MRHNSEDVQILLGRKEQEMTDHKFTDDEIIEILNAYVERMCGKCNLKGIDICCNTCFIKAISQAADLINRQRAEIKRLYIALEETQKATKYWKDIAHRETGYIKAARAEAIKEFAERLKANMSNIARMEYGGNIYFCVGYDLIDNLVKEMTEEIK